MSNTTIRIRLAALVCTVLVSTACLVGAVGPATGNNAAPFSSPLSSGVASGTLA